MFECHINVEVCNSIRAIKYVIKYVNKGSDMAAFALKNPNNEVDVYQAARYVSCSEACWRLFGFSIHDRFPAVITLQVHLENMQNVLFTEDNACEQADAPPKTTLTAFFDLCSKYRANIDNKFSDADTKFVQNLLYVNVPEYFVLQQKSKCWVPRVKGKEVYTDDGQLTTFKQSTAIGRVYTVNPKQMECFFLRLLLHRRPGSTSFEDLRTVNNETLPSYREACRSLGFLEDDAHWGTAMQEAAVYATASALRTLFALILTSCHPSYPMQLWEAHKLSMTDDILYRSRRNAQRPDLAISSEMLNETLVCLEDLVHQMSGKKLSDFHLPSPNRQGDLYLYIRIKKYLHTFKIRYFSRKLA